MFASLVILLSLSAGIMIVFSSARTFACNGPFVCDPNGDLWVFEETTLPCYPFWSAKYGLSITGGFGTYSLKTVRLIDITWDFVMGRIFQALFVYGAYRYVNGLQVNYMREYDDRFETIIALQYYPSSFTAMWTLVKGVFHRPPGGRRLIPRALGRAILALFTLYTLAMPTWLGAMTGTYVSFSTPRGGHKAELDIRLSGNHGSSNTNSRSYCRLR